MKAEIFGAGCLLCMILMFLYVKNVRIEETVFTESNRELKNPNRGFYFIYGFMIQDEETDYAELVKERYQNDTDTTITLVHINLQNYRNGEITQKGLANIEELFHALETIDKRLIVRFSYDWDGMAMGREPGRLDTILLHIRQLEEILHRHQQKIFLLQGLFIGNWGEMNGTPYANSEDMQRLALELAKGTDPSIYLSVRMPMYWRQITRMKEPLEKYVSADPLAGRLGLFNDGMLGSESDYGTYGLEKASEAGDFSPWSREEELDFQEELCRWTPNGGEVIVDNGYNDFEYARKDLATMHISYLNRDYDQEVLEKWQRKTVREDSCFDGMDGLSYIERHLGYRFFITDTAISRQFLKNRLSVKVTLKNVGFAPIYREPDIQVLVCSEKENFSYTIHQPLSQLSGGIHKEEQLTFDVRIPLKELSEKEYSLYFSIVDPDTGKQILLANEQEEEEFGYLLGKVHLR